MYDLQEIRKDNMLVFSPTGLSRNHNIDLCFTSRQGGISRSPYNSLNLAYHVGDDDGNVSCNRSLVLKNMDLGSKLYDLNQIHSDKIINLEDQIYKDNGAKTEADCLVTGLRGKALMVMGADCNLMILADTEKKIIAAVHSGWKGTLKKILSKTIKYLKDNYGSVASGLLLYLGPSIRRCCYHVQENLLQKFMGVFGKGDYYDFRNDKIYLDLAGLNKFQGLDAGLSEKNIVDCGFCTSCDPRFFSYRQQKITGRQAAIGMVRG